MKIGYCHVFYKTDVIPMGTICAPLLSDILIHVLHTWTTPKKREEISSIL